MFRNSIVESTTAWIQESISNRNSILLQTAHIKLSQISPVAHVETIRITIFKVGI